MMVHIQPWKSDNNPIVLAAWLECSGPVGNTIFSTMSNLDKWVDEAPIKVSPHYSQTDHTKDLKALSTMPMHHAQKSNFFLLIYFSVVLVLTI